MVWLTRFWPGASNFLVDFMSDLSREVTV